MNSRRKNNISKKDKKKAIGIVLIIAALMTVAAFGLRIWENNSYAVDNSGYEANINKPEVHEIEDNGDIYRRRDDIESYLFIGVDQEGTAQSNGSYIEGGQGDVQMLLVLDDKNKTWQVLQLNRDTITDVPVLGVFGDVVSSERQQLALAHAIRKNLGAVRIQTYRSELKGVWISCNNIVRYEIDDAYYEFRRIKGY